MAVIPKHRFTEEILTINGDVIWIHLIDVGGRTYVSYLSDITCPRRVLRVFPLPEMNGTVSWDYELDASNYLAVKCDEMGDIDIAFQRTNEGPVWILNQNSGTPFQAKVSMI